MVTGLTMAKALQTEFKVGKSTSKQITNQKLTGVFHDNVTELLKAGGLWNKSWRRDYVKNR